MADELEPVEQQFIADFADYVEPMQDASDDTRGFADVVHEATGGVRGLRDEAAETGESLTGLGGGADDSTGQIEGFREAEDSARDSAAGLDHELHDQTESFFADAMAIDTVTGSLAGLSEAQQAAGRDASGLQNTLAQLRDELGGAGLGDTIAVTKTGLNQFAVSGAQDLERLDSSLRGTGRDAEVTSESIRAIGLEADEAFMAGRTAVDDMRANLGRLAADITALETGKAAGGGGFFYQIAKFFSAGAGGSGEDITSVFAAITKNVGAFSAGMALFAPAIAALIQETGLLVTGFTAATAGLGAFALFAVPTLDKIKTSYEGITAAQRAYHAAVQLEARDPTKDNLAAEKTALAQLQIAWADVPKAIRPALRGIDEFKSEYSSLARALEPDVLKVFNAGLKIADEFLPQLKPFADDAATAIDGLLKKLGKFLDPTQITGWRNNKPVMGPSPFGQWLTDFEKISPGAITAIGNGIGEVAAAFGKLMTALPPQDVTNAINIAFKILGGTLDFAAFAAKNVAHEWDRMSGSFEEAGRNVRRWSDDIGRDFEHMYHDVSRYQDDIKSDVRRAWDDAAGYVRQSWDRITGDVSSAGERIRADVDTFMSRVRTDWDHDWSKVVTYAKGIPHRIVTALGSISTLLVSAGESLIEGLISGIEDKIPGLSSTVGDVRKILDDIGGFFTGSGGGGGGHAAPGAGGRAGPLGAGMFAPPPGAGAAPNITVHVHVAGTVIAGHELADTVQRAILDKAQMNGNSGLVLPGRRF